METFVGIGERLKEERERLGLSQTEFAALAGASKNTQYNYEKGERSPDANYLAAAALQGVDVLYVVVGERQQQPIDSLTKQEALMVAHMREIGDENLSIVERVLNAFMASEQVKRTERK